MSEVLNGISIIAGVGIVILTIINIIIYRKKHLHKH